MKNQKTSQITLFIWYGFCRAGLGGVKVSGGVGSSRLGVHRLVKIGATSGLTHKRQKTAGTPPPPPVQLRDVWSIVFVRLFVQSNFSADGPIKRTWLPNPT